MKETILIVDDSPANLQLLEGILMKKDYKVRTAPNGLYALKTVEKAKPDLILLDIKMPMLDGYQVCKKLKENPESKYIPVIFITSLDTASYESKGFQLGAVDYITKPFNPAVVIARVQTQIKLRNAFLMQKELQEKTVSGVIALLSSIIDLSYPDVFLLTNRITDNIVSMVRILNLSNPWQYKLAGLMSQIGCITLSTDILSKVSSKSKMSIEEERLIKDHPQVGCDLVQNIPHLQTIGQMIALQDKDIEELEQEPYDDTAKTGGKILKTVLDYDRKINLGEKSESIIIDMLNDQKKYDEVIVCALKETVIAREKKKSLPVISITKVKDLTPGMIIAEKIVSTTGRVLLTKDFKLTEAAIKRLEHYVNIDKLKQKFKVFGNIYSKSMIL